MVDHTKRHILNQISIPSDRLVERIDLPGDAAPNRFTSEPRVELAAMLPTDGLLVSEAIIRAGETVRRFMLVAA